LDRNMVYDRTL